MSTADDIDEREVEGDVEGDGTAPEASGPVGPPVAHWRALAPSLGGASCVRLLRGSDGVDKIVYLREDDGFAIMVEEPDSGWKRRIAAYAEPVSALEVSPGGELIAYLIGSSGNPPEERRVAWAQTSAPREQGRVSGTAFAFGPSKPALYVVDGKEHALFRHDPVTGKSKRLADVPDAGIITFPSEVVVSPDATRIAVTSRRALRDLTEVWIVSPEGTSLLTQVPGAEIHVHPFWSKGGKTLGLHIVHPDQDQSAIIIVHKLEGEGEIYHEAEALDGYPSPAWSPSTRYLAFFPQSEGLPRLSLLDLETKAILPILDPGDAADATRIRFLDDRHLLLEGGQKAHVLTFDDPL